MTIAVTRRLTTLSLVIFLLTGCSNLSIFDPSPEAIEAERFAQGVDQYRASGDLTTLQQISEQSPRPEWRARAETVISMDTKQKELQKQLQQQSQKHSKESEELLAQCQLEKSHLIQENQILEKTLSQLKDLLIDTEQRAEK
jgi:outer membrane biogenesis lipoprotein LolB